MCILALTFKFTSVQNQLFNKWIAFLLRIVLPKWHVKFLVFQVWLDTVLKPFSMNNVNMWLIQFNEIEQTSKGPLSNRASLLRSRTLWQFEALTFSYKNTSLNSKPTHKTMTETDICVHLCVCGVDVLHVVQINTHMQQVVSDISQCRVWTPWWSRTEPMRLNFN